MREIYNDGANVRCKVSLNKYHNVLIYNNIKLRKSLVGLPVHQPGVCQDTQTDRQTVRMEVTNTTGDSDRLEINDRHISNA